MPKIPIKFENSIIYKLVCLDTTFPEVYVGSTTNFKQRKSSHKSNCYNKNSKDYNYKVYQFMREHGGFKNFAMIEIEKYACETKRQLEAREEHWRKELGATLNGNRAFTTDEEKRILRNELNSEWQRNAGHEKHLITMKKWRDANKEQIKQKRREYYQRKKLEKLNQKIPETNNIEN